VPARREAGIDQGQRRRQVLCRGTPQHDPLGAQQGLFRRGFEVRRAEIHAHVHARHAVGGVATVEEEGHCRRLTQFHAPEEPVRPDTLHRPHGQAARGKRCLDAVEQRCRDPTPAIVRVHAKQFDYPGRPDVVQLAHAAEDHADQAPVLPGEQAQIRSRSGVVQSVEAHVRQMVDGVHVQRADEPEHGIEICGAEFGDVHGETLLTRRL